MDRFNLSYKLLVIAVLSLCGALFAAGKQMFSSDWAINLAGGFVLSALVLGLLVAWGSWADKPAE